MEKRITKAILREELAFGGKPAAEVLYNRYGGMLFSYIRQFVPSRGEAENLLVKIFASVSCQVEEAFASNLSIYCWLQIQARKIILEQRGLESGVVFPRESGSGEMKTYYFSLLEDASPEHQEVFRELFLNGQQRDELARQMNKDQAYVGHLLMECMQIIRKKIG